MSNKYIHLNLFTNKDKYITILYTIYSIILLFLYLQTKLNK